MVYYVGDKVRIMMFYEFFLVLECGDEVVFFNCVGEFVGKGKVMFVILCEKSMGDIVVVMVEVLIEFVWEVRIIYVFGGEEDD